MSIKKSLDKLKDVDIYSLMLFALYKFVDIPEYSALSELIYVLDKKNLLNLCEYFGGLTLRVPTIDELEILAGALLLYQYINLEGKSYEEGSKLINCNTNQLRAIKRNYLKLVDILNNYEFSRRDK